jgi:integrase
MDLFAEITDTDNGKVKPLSFEQYQKLITQLGKRSKDAILPVQIAYFTGLRLGEVAGLTWQDINFEEQCLTVRRSVRYNGATHKHEIGSTKRKKFG